jgi:hypothetical protein
MYIAEKFENFIWTFCMTEGGAKLELVSVHFAKAGGTSLWSELKGHYGDSLFSDNNHDPCNSTQKFNKPSVLASCVRAVHGHIRPDLYDLQPETRLITFLREPADKLLSAYYFWLGLPRHGSPEHEAFLADRPSILEYAEQTVGVAFSAYFGGFDMDRFDFIGFHDRRRQDIARLSELLGFEISSEVRANPTPYSPERLEFQSDELKMRQLREILKPDIEFYNELRSRWSVPVSERN